MFVLPGVSAVLGVNALEIICLLQVVKCAPHVAELHLHLGPCNTKDILSWNEREGQQPQRNMA